MPDTTGWSEQRLFTGWLAFQLGIEQERLDGDDGEEVAKEWIRVCGAQLRTLGVLPASIPASDSDSDLDVAYRIAKHLLEAGLKEDLPAEFEGFFFGMAFKRVDGLPESTMRGTFSKMNRDLVRVAQCVGYGYERWDRDEEWDLTEVAAEAEIYLLALLFLYEEPAVSA